MGPPTWVPPHALAVLGLRPGDLGDLGWESIGAPRWGWFHEVISISLPKFNTYGNASVKLEQLGVKKMTKNHA
jgi:hypothetical protein